MPRGACAVLLLSTCVSLGLCGCKRASSSCDQAALRTGSETIATDWDGWTPQTGTVPDFSLDAASTVWNACPSLPDGGKTTLDFMFEHPRTESMAAAYGAPPHASKDEFLARLETALPGHARTHPEDGLLPPAALAWMSSVCPEAETLMERSDTPGSAVWDACLSKLGLIEHEQWIARRGTSGLEGFALVHWLTDGGIDPKVAAPLGRALVFNGHWLVRPPEDVRLPAAEVTTSADGGIPLELGPHEIRFSGHEVASLDASGRLVPALVTGSPPMVGPLFDAMAEQVDHATEQAAGQGSTWSGEALVTAHRDLPWSTVGPSLAAAHLAGFERISLVVLAADRIDPVRSLTVHDATATEPLSGLTDDTTVQELVDAIVARQGKSVRLFPR